MEKVEHHKNKFNSIGKHEEKLVKSISECNNSLTESKRADDTDQNSNKFTVNEQNTVLVTDENKGNGNETKGIYEKDVMSCTSCLDNNEEKDKCLKCQHRIQQKTNVQIMNGVHVSKDFGLYNGSVIENNINNENAFSNATSSSDTESLPPTVDLNSSSASESAALVDQFSLCTSIISKCNVNPNPDEFYLIEKNDLSMHKVNKVDNETQSFTDNSIVISNSNAIPQSDSIVTSNYSLSQLLSYCSDDDDDDSVIEEVPVAAQQYRESQEIEDSDSDSDSSSSSSTSIVISGSSSDATESDNIYENCNRKPASYTPVKAKGELDLEDLPPIEDLTISVPEEECTPIGKVFQIVDKLVVIQGYKDSPAYDLDTVLFTQDGQPLGQIFDVFGPVIEPHYCIRFNSKDHIKEKNITLGQTVYSAPKSPHTKYVFLAQLMKLRGSDASWENDIEPPEIYLEYSDDEQEQKAKKRFSKSKKAVSKPELDPDEPARKKHAAYVKKMNARNLRMSASRNIHNFQNNVLWQPNLQPPRGPLPPLPPPRPSMSCHQIFGRPPLFQARVPHLNMPFSHHSGPYEYSQPRLNYPNCSSLSPGPLQVNRPEQPGAFKMQPYSVPPSQMYCSPRGPSNQGPINSTPSEWNQSFPLPRSPWLQGFPPPPSPPPRHIIPPRNRSPMSPFYINKPVNNPGYYPNKPSQWHIHQPDNSGNASTSNSLRLNFKHTFPPQSPEISRK